MVNGERLLYNAGNCAHGADSRAQAASFALGGDDAVVQKRLAVSGGAAFLPDMRLIFIAEKVKGGKYRVGGCLSQTAERILLYVIAQLFHFIDIFHGPLALGNLI